MNNLIMIGKSRTQDAEQCRRGRTSDGEQSKKLAMDSLPDLRRKDKDKVYKSTVLINFPLFCPRCKKETYIDVVQLKMVLSK